MLAPSSAPDYTFSDLNSVSCVSVGNCVAIGDYRISTVQNEGYYAVETSGVWARGVQLPLPGDAQSTPAQTAFVSASCVLGGTTCKLLGQYVTNNIPPAIHSVVDTYVFGTGITGPPVEFAQLSGQDGIELNSISCTTSTNCVAVGSQTKSFSSEATYVADTAGTWGTPTVLTNPGGAAVPYEFLTSVSCPTSGNCVAAGLFGDSGAEVFAETYTETGGVWGTSVDIGQPSNLNFPYVDSISCVATVTTCTLVGSLSDGQSALHAVTAQMTAGHWGQLAPAGVPSGGISDDEFLGISCTTGIQCTAVGYYNLSTVTGGTEAMASTWSIGAPPGPISSLKKLSVTSTTASLTWSPATNPGTGIDHYEIYATQAGSGPVDKGPAAGTSQTVTKLTPGATYTFSVVTVAADGQTSTPVAIALALPATVPSAPKIVRVAGVHLGLSVTWQPPKSTGGAPISTYAISASCQGSAKHVRAAGTARHVTIAGLRARATCAVQVAATNRAGTGLPSAPVIGHVLA
jgi:hypothetical protein